MRYERILIALIFAAVILIAVTMVTHAINPSCPAAGSASAAAHYVAGC